MKTIIVVNDGTAHARHAANQAFIIAQKVNADLLLANVVKVNHRVAINQQTAVMHSGNWETENVTTSIFDYLQMLNKATTGFKPTIRSLENVELQEKHLIDLVNKNKIWMIVKGMPEFADTNPDAPFFNIHAVLNRVRCPILLVPGNFPLRDFERMVYMADLRYCRLFVVRYLVELARSYKANALITHLSASGLPDIVPQYAREIFNEQISSCMNYDKLFFNNIKERNLLKAVDVIINGMNSDLLLLVNHQFHFREILGRYIKKALPGHINIPLLIFPF